MTKKIRDWFWKSVSSVNFYGVVLLARGGGGGSGGGGGGGGGGGFSGGSSGSSGNSSPLLNGLFFLVFVAVVVIGVIAERKRRKMLREKNTALLASNHLDQKDVEQKITDLFTQFQFAWGTTELTTLEKLVTPEFYKRLVLELAVLKNLHRSNTMSEVRVTEILLVGEEQPGEKTQKLEVQITASATDVLTDTETGEHLFVDTSAFTEFWHLVQSETGAWKLDLITQATEEASSYEPEIASFAKEHGFYYDADFGWLMMPNRGVLFGKTNFGNSDINNHVVGYFKDKIVEFYTYVPNTNSKAPTNYLVAQAILPKSYTNILVKRKGFFNFAPSGLRRQELEWPDFNKKFCLWAADPDKVNSLELLTPNFMEKIYSLPFEVNIEIVGNVLYFYSKNRPTGNYPQLLEVLSWAFDEMHM